MDVFGVHRQLVADYSDFTTGVTEIRDAAAMAEIDAIAARDVFALRVDEVAAILGTSKDGDEPVGPVGRALHRELAPINPTDGAIEEAQAELDRHPDEAD